MATVSARCPAAALDTGASAVGCRTGARLQRCMAIASAVGTGFAPQISVVRRSMFDVTSTCGSHRAIAAHNVCADE